MKESVVIGAASLVLRHKRDGRCVYSQEGKLALVEACSRPSASVAAIALAHGVNANLLRKWITRYGASRAARPALDAPQTLLPVMIADIALLLPRKAAGKPSGTASSATQGLASVPTQQDCTRPSLLAIELKGDGATRIELTGLIDREALAVVLDCLTLKQSRAAP